MNEISEVAICNVSCEVNYDLPLPTLINQACFDRFDSEVLKVPFVEQWSGRGQHSITFDLLRIVDEYSPTKCIEEIRGRGFRPAILAELVSIGSARPCQEIQGAIVALGSIFWRIPKVEVVVPVINIFGTGIKLSAFTFGSASQWGAGCRFACVSNLINDRVDKT
jgi:hypothetical protein